MKYRAELDGLRALAVIAVVLFHAGFSYFSGGFIGVDIFFVLSGYLITTIILTDLNRDTFSLAKFYSRRARRILPALFLVALVTFAVAWFWLRPADMKDLAESLITIPYFISNVLFWLESGYWGTENALKPLLHTWTLAIEAQYYLIFPLYLALVWRLGKRWALGSLWILAIASFGLSQWAAYHLPSANFFLLPSRWWELSMGAIIAFHLLQQDTPSTQTSNAAPANVQTADHEQSTAVDLQASTLSIATQNLNLSDAKNGRSQQHSPSLQSPHVNDVINTTFPAWVNQGLGWLGLSLIIYAIIAFDETIPFPSVFTLIPTIGTGLIIIFTSAQQGVGKFLSFKLFVGIGLISYSAYLWHQPLFAFARHRSLTEPSLLLLISLAVLTVPLAYLSWRFIEQPFRSRQFISGKTIFLFWLVGSVALVEIGVMGHLTDGFIGRVPPSQSIARSVPHFQGIVQSPLALPATTATQAVSEPLDSAQAAQLNVPYFGDEPVPVSSVAAVTNSTTTDTNQATTTPKSASDRPDLNAYDNNFSVDRYSNGLSVRCDGPFNLLPDCRTSDEPEILVWGDSFAMHLIPGILASNSDAKIIQMTQSVCGPFFDVAPISEPEYPPSWAKRCLEFTGKVREWLKTNDTVRYAVLSSPFFNYVMADEVLILRTGEHVIANLDLAISEFKKTLNEFVAMGIQPVIFSPPPANGVDLGRCLASADWQGRSLTACDFERENMTEMRLATYDFLAAIAAAQYPVIRLDELMCEAETCQTHMGDTWLYKDKGHLSSEGSAALGQKYDFYSLITTARNPSLQPREAGSAAPDPANS